jgi:2-polyprenyl-3-methyl-5-hydroxy-6-metoxy-1,4-benzoquinol methylase
MTTRRDTILLEVRGNLVETKSGKLSCADRAGAEFWEDWWKRTPLPSPFDPYRPGLKNYVVRRFHHTFELLFEGYDTSSMELAEVGCAQSVYLPYFAKQFGFKVCGIDRSEMGCDRARAILEREGVKGEVYCGDFFSLPPHLTARFDVVVSFGVVEHFEPAAEAVRAMVRLLRPEGRMFTNIPNLTGILRCQKLFDRDIYDAHVALTREGLASAHRDAGLEVESCDYFLPVSLNVFNLERWPRHFLYWLATRSFTALSRAVWLVDENVFRLPQNRWTSPYISCVGRKPGAKG